jgi:pilus assembly protein Flp/PilA
MIDKTVTSAPARFRDDEGATATEYIVLLVFIAIAIIVGATLFGEALNGVFGEAGERVELETGTETGTTE